MNKAHEEFKTFILTLFPFIAWAIVLGLSASSSAKPSEKKKSIEDQLVESRDKLIEAQKRIDRLIDEIRKLQCRAVLGQPKKEK